MAKGETAPAKPKEMKPSLRVDVSPKTNLPKLGEQVTISATGTVVSAGMSKDRWASNPKATAHIEIEYEGFDSITVSGPRKKRSAAELEKENPRV